jgi:hypothetical protein
MSLALSRQFAAARLSLVVEQKPLDSGRRVDSVEIVQLDIRRNLGRTLAREEYRIFPGNTRTNRIDVADADRSQQQLVLVVDEPKRAFTITVPRGRGIAAGPDLRVVSETDTQRVIEMQTTGRLRHFLCGLDEAHLFIAQLPRAVANVRDAHEALAPEIPPQYQRGVHRRQGEWFFLPITAEERAELNLVSPKSIRSGGLAEVARIRRHGRQHVATQAVLVEQGNRLYARGQIWHPDHAPLALRGWHRVLINREPFETVPRRVGIRWVD